MHLPKYQFPIQYSPVAAKRSKISIVEEVKDEAHNQGVITRPDLENGPEDKFKFLCNSKKEHTHTLGQ